MADISVREAKFISQSINNAATGYQTSPGTRHRSHLDGVSPGLRKGLTVRTKLSTIVWSLHQRLESVGIIRDDSVHSLGYSAGN